MNQLDFVLRETQLPYLYHRPGPLEMVMMLMHRRGGKSEGYVAARLNTRINWLLSLDKIPIIGRDVYFDYPKFGFFAKTKESARNIIWLIFLKYLHIFPGVDLNEHKLRVTIPRPKLGDHITINLKAARNYDDVRGERYFEMMLDEYQEYPEKAWAVIFATLTDLEGVAYIAGTAKGMNNILYQRLRDLIDPESPFKGKYWMYPVNRTNVFTQEKLALIRANMSSEEFEREYNLNFMVSYGKTYYGELINKFTKIREKFCRYNPKLPIIMAVDIGVGKSFAAWLAQVQGKEIVILDYYEDYELMEDLRLDIKDDWDRAIDYLALPHDENKRQMSYKRVTRNRDIFKLAFPEAEFISVQQIGRKAMDITLVKENFHLVSYLEQKSKATDLNSGLTKLGQYGPKTNESGIITGAEDSGSGTAHCADAFRYLLRALQVSNGRIGRTLSKRNGGIGRTLIKMPSFRRNTQRRGYAQRI